MTLSLRALWLRLFPAVSQEGNDINSGQLALSSDTLPVERMGLLMLVLGLGGFLLWAVFAPIDEGVPMQGMVTVDTKRKPVQHLTGGLIEQVFVREAQLVTAGDPLIRLNDGNLKANFEAARQRYLGLRAMEDRLLAERLGHTEIIFHPDVQEGKDDPIIAQHTNTQEQLIKSRRLALESEMNAIDQAIRGQEEAARGLESQMGSRRRQLAYVNKEREGLAGLVEENYAPRNKLWEMERMAAEISAATGDIQANLARARRGSSEMVLRKIQRREEFRREVDTQLAEIKREVAADEERYKATRQELERAMIRAPASGSVVGIANQTIGGVIQPGARIMDIVPADEALILETRIPPHLVDRLVVGQLADVRFSNFSHTPQLIVEGKLLSVSADLLSDPATGAGYYLGRISVTPLGLQSLAGRQLQPGMPVDIVIKTGERSLLTYILSPLLRRLANGMKEE